MKLLVIGSGGREHAVASATGDGPRRFARRRMGQAGVAPSFSPSFTSVPSSIGVSYSAAAFAFLVRKPHSKPMERLNKYRL
jgi:hypothetical protein